MRTTLRTSALLIAAALILTGCSGGPDVLEEAEIAPATGPVISGNGYSFTAPEDWEQADASIAPGTDVVVWDTAETGDFSDNANVVISPAGLVDLERVEQATAAELEEHGAEHVTIKDRLTLNGVEHTHVAARMTEQGITYVAEQFALNSDSQTYLVTFSFDESVPEANRIELAKSVLVTWSFD